MRILFVISATLWSWVVGRVIAFGIGIEACKWMPNMTADSWYRLTPIRYPIPYKWFNYMPIYIAAAFIPALIIDNDILHAVSVVSLALQHAFVPLFVAQIHDGKTLITWGSCCIGATIATILLLCIDLNTISIIALVLQCFILCLMIWLSAIEIYVTFVTHVIHQPPEELPRVPRTV